jgi:hypothetical protein
MRTDGRTGRYDEANSRLRNFANWLKKGQIYSLISFPALFFVYIHIRVLGRLGLNNIMYTDYYIP